MTNPGSAPAPRALSGPLVLAEGLHKRFGRTTALAGVDLAVQQGTVVGLLGPNGAGKTTTVRVLTTLLRPDAGRALVAGYDVVREPQQVRARIGLTGQYAAVDELLTGRENLVMVGQLSRLSGRQARRRADELLERFRLTGAAATRAGGYSGGMRRRLDLAASLMVAPPLLVLDEPTTGLDPRSRIELWQTISDLVVEGTTVLLTTQYLEEADRLADRIVVIDHGRVIAEGTSAELKARAGTSRLEIEVADLAVVSAAATVLAETTGEEIETEQGSGWLRAPADGVTTLTDALLALQRVDIAVVDAAIRRPSLDEVFLQLTGQPSTSDRAAADDEQEVLV